MEERNAPYAEAVLTEGERIKARGSFDAVKAQASKEAHLADLQGRTMIPGFNDPHSHFTACAGKNLEADLSEAETFLDIIRIVKRLSGKIR